MHYAIQPERDLNKSRLPEPGPIPDPDETHFVACAEIDAEHWSVYRSESGSIGDYELVNDFPERWSAEAFVALCQIRDIDNELNRLEEVPTANSYNEVVALALDVLRQWEKR